MNTFLSVLAALAVYDIAKFFLTWRAAGWLVRFDVAVTRDDDVQSDMGLVRRIRHGE